MSDANRVSVKYAKAQNYGEVPDNTVEWNTARFRSETLSATPTTEVSAEIRQDRQRSDQIKVGLESTGALEIELSALSYEEFMLAAMCDTDWTPTGRTSIAAPDAAASIDADGNITGTTDWVAAGIEAGMNVAIGGFSDPANNGTFRALKVGVGSLTVSNPAAVVDGPASITVDWTAPTSEDEIMIGLVDRDYAIEVAFEDVTKFLMFTGQRVGEMNLNFQYGSILTGSFVFRGQNALPAAVSGIPGGATVNAATTTPVLNASSDVPYVVIDGEISSEIILQQVELAVNNNLRDVVGISYDGPANINKGSATVTGTLEAYLSGASWKLYESGVLQQMPMALTFSVTDGTYGYEFHLPRVKLSGEAPQPTGIDTDVMINPSFTALLDSTVGNTLRIRRITL